jgi:hypothetical protein
MATANIAHRRPTRRQSAALFINAANHPAVQAYCKAKRYLLQVRNVRDQLMLAFSDGLEVLETPAEMIEHAKRSL